MLSNEHGFAHAIWNCARTGLAVQCAPVSRCYQHMQLPNMDNSPTATGREVQASLVGTPFRLKGPPHASHPTITLASNI